MATKEELYVSISPESYKFGKANVLMGQADLLNTMKRLYSLSVLARQKQDLKKKLHKLLSVIIVDIDSIQSRMPNPTIPKEIKKVEKTNAKIKTSFSKYNDIDEELELIHEKLRKLNS